MPQYNNYSRKRNTLIGHAQQAYQLSQLLRSLKAIPAQSSTSSRSRTTRRRQPVQYQYGAKIYKTHKKKPTKTQVRTRKLAQLVGHGNKTI